MRPPPFQGEDLPFKVRPPSRGCVFSCPDDEGAPGQSGAATRKGRYYTGGCPTRHPGRPHHLPPETPPSRKRQPDGRPGRACLMARSEDARLCVLCPPVPCDVDCCDCSSACCTHREWTFLSSRRRVGVWYAVFPERLGKKHTNTPQYAVPTAVVPVVRDL